MAIPDDGGPAFPMPFSTDEHATACNTTVMQPVMTLRDYFAAQAIGNSAFIDERAEGLPSGDMHVVGEYVAEWAYAIADAMLAERRRDR